ncbi:MAG: trypsin-like peptidase domain-containing protein [Planctomycetia bacterium]|nr:trypsin-like peptidase domain-containing protein [Planctomycetia bacterium]
MSLSSRRRSFTWVLFLIVSLAVHEPVFAGEPESVPSRRNAIVSVVEKSKASVVNIHSERMTAIPYGDRSMGGSSGRSNGMGTGIILDPRGYIVTNFHVVDEVTKLQVRLNGEEERYDAVVVAKDKESDLAVIKINAKKPLPVIKLGTSSDLMVGETVIAIGNAFGYEHTVSMGIVSALGRDVVLNKEVNYKQLIQTNASINPGNSGGPLLNIDGELIGVNVAIRAGAQGISFAIPVDSMLETVSDLLARSRRHAFPTGLQYRDKVFVAQNPCRALVVEKVQGNSLADKAGLKTGDTILTVNNQSIACGLDFERALLEAKPGEKLAVKYRRGKEEKQVEWAFESKADLTQADPLWRELGLKLTTTDSESITRLYAHLHGGMLVTEVLSQGPAAKAGIQAGDILVGLQNWETCNFDNVNYVLNHENYANFKPLQFHIIRKGQLHRGSFVKE